MIDFTDQVVIVTGAGRGLGRLYAREIARRGGAIVRAAIERFGRLDAVLSNARFTHHNHSACAGRYARVFIGLAEGWLAEPARKPTADDIAAHLDELSATEPFSVPASIFDEVAGICTRLGIR